ncbi:MAG: hypothetical protein QMD01_00400 [Thermodesulfovibrionales bacterium]|nr:hypothetical protein [Thermodesulfovibrionales bacterium]
MARFEELQMKIAESAKNYLEIYNMQVLIEQFTLDRESKFFISLPNIEPPFPLSAIVSFIYDAFQTGMTLYEDSATEDAADIDTSIELEFLIKLPVMEGYPDIEALLEEISEMFPDTEPILITKEIFPGDELIKEYEISYAYNIEPEDIVDNELLNEMFEELRGILGLIYKRTVNYIDTAWYKEEEE